MHPSTVYGKVVLICPCLVYTDVYMDQSGAVVKGPWKGEFSA